MDVLLFVYGFGSGQDNWQNYAQQISIGLVGNFVGNRFATQAFGRAVSPLIRNAFSTASGEATEYAVDGISIIITTIIINKSGVVMFKINLMQIRKFITAVVCFSLFGFAVYSMDQSKASPLPFLICACILYVVDRIISYILIKKGHENSPYFDPKHQWKYGAPIDIIVFSDCHRDIQVFVIILQ